MLSLNLCLIFKCTVTCFFNSFSIILGKKDTLCFHCNLDNSSISAWIQNEALWESESSASCMHLYGCSYSQWDSGGETLDKQVCSLCLGVSLRNVCSCLFLYCTTHPALQEAADTCQPYLCLLFIKGPMKCYILLLTVYKVSTGNAFLHACTMTFLFTADGICVCIDVVYVSLCFCVCACVVVFLTQHFVYVFFSLTFLFKVAWKAAVMVDDQRATTKALALSVVLLSFSLL